MSIIKILAIDGGGIRGIIPAMVLAEIEGRTSKPIAELFDLIAGTSTGGILALGQTKLNEVGDRIDDASHKSIDSLKYLEQQVISDYDRDLETFCQQLVAAGSRSLPRRIPEFDLSDRTLTSFVEV